jgi:hypothetical protein
MTKKSTTLKKTQNKRNEGVFLKKWQIEIFLTIIGLSYLLFWYYHGVVIENKDAVIEQVNILCDNYEKDRKLLYDLNKELRGELRDIYEKRNVTSLLPPTIPIENVSNYT